MVKNRLIRNRGFTYVNAKGLGKALDDGQEGVGGQHWRLVRVRVDDFGRHYIWNKFAIRNKKKICKK